jgi:hypothetical protein
MKPEPMDDNLLGYLLDALDPDAYRAVDAHLRHHPEARARLEELRQMLAPLADDAAAPEPPPNLAASTLARVAAVRAAGRLLAAPPPSRRQIGTPLRRGPRRADLVVTALILFLSAGMGMTWLARQWRDYRILACQNNLHGIWTALQVYADGHTEGGGAFPRVESEPPRNFAGVYAPVLRDAGAMDADVSTVCPAQNQRPTTTCSLSELEELSRNRPDEYHALTRDLGGDYAYTLGYRVGDDLMGLRRDSGNLLPILADSPRTDGRGNSPNHGGAGQNVLYIGGQVRWCVEPTVGVDRDDIYRNLKNRVLAGEHQFDTVLGPSEAAPCLEP